MAINIPSWLSRNELSQTSAYKRIQEANRLVRANPRQAMLGVGAAFGFGVLNNNEGRGPLETTLVLGPLAAVGAVAIGSNLPKIKQFRKDIGEVGRFLWRAPTQWNGPGAAKWQNEVNVAARTNPLVRSIFKDTYGSAGREELFARASSNIDYVDEVTRLLGGQGIEAGAELPLWAKTAAASAAAAHNPGIHGLGTLGRLSTAKKLDEALAKWNTPEDIIAAAKSDPRLGELLSERLSAWRGATANMGFVDFSDVTRGMTPDQLGRAVNKEGIVTEASTKDLTARLRGMGKQELAAEIDALVESNPNMKAVGINWQNIGRDNLQGIRIFDGQNELFEIPVVGTGGEVFKGPSGKNLYIARKQILAGSVTQGGTLETVDLDVAVARYMRQYGSRARAMGLGGKFNKYLEKIMDSALTWENENFRRPDRTGDAMSADVQLRKLQQQLLLPEERAITELIGAGHLLKDGRLNITGLVDIMKTYGLGQFGSEGSAKQGVFYNYNQIAALDYGLYNTPPNKAAQLFRDFGKSYGLMTEGAGTARQELFSMPFATSEFRKRLGNTKPPIMMHKQGVYEGELEFLSEIFDTGEFGGKEARQIRADRIGGFLESLGVTSQHARYRSAFESLVNIREGLSANEIPQGIYMYSNQTKVLATLDKRVRGLRPGDIIPMDLIMGTTDSDLPVRPMMSNRSVGKSIFQGFEANNDGTYTVKWREMIPARYAKFGSAVGKTMPVALQEGDSELIIDLINRMRRHASNKNLSGMMQDAGLAQRIIRAYAGQSAITEMAAPIKGAVASFELYGALAKTQGIHKALVQNLFATELRQMSLGERKRYMRELRSIGVTPALKKTKGFRREYEINTGSGNIHEKYGRLTSLVTKHYEGKYGSISDAIMRTGILTEAMAWDATMLNIPRSAGISNIELRMLEEMGYKNTMSSMLNRMIKSGTVEGAKQFERGYQTLFGSAIRNPADKEFAKLNIPIFKLNETVLGDFNISDSFRLDPKYRTGMFLIDLEQANSNLAAGSLERVLGRTKLFMPGLDSDLYNKTFYLQGEMHSSEEFIPHINRLIYSVRKAHETGEVKHLESARGSLANYMKAVEAARGAMLLGRKGAVGDAGPFAAGRLTHRAYAKKFAGHDVKDIGQFVVGLSESQYDRLFGSDAKFGFQVGYTLREPITGLDPAVFYRDSSLAEGEIALDEARRLSTMHDYDGDTVIAKVLTNDESRAEMFNTILSPNSPQYKAYRKRAEHLKATAESLDSLESEASIIGGFEDVRSAIQGRVDKFAPLIDPSTGQLIADTGQMSAKLFTTHIGQYSNLSDMLKFIARGGEFADEAMMARYRVATILKQTSIDFGRKYKPGFDPSASADKIRESFQAAARESTELGNKLLGEVFEDLNMPGIINEAVEKMATGPNVSIEDAARVRRIGETVQDAMKNYYTGIDPANIERARSAIPEIMTKGIQYENLDDIEQKLRAILGAEMSANDLGVPIAGPGALSSRAMLTMTNRMSKTYMGAKHILKDAYINVKGSPQAKALAGGAIVTGSLMGLFGLMKSPAPMDEPDFDANVMAPDAAYIGMDGEAPAPGARAGNVAERGTARRPIRQEKSEWPKMPGSRRMYVEQTNRTPRVRYYSSGDPYDANAYAQEVDAGIRSQSGGGANINIVHDATSRRLSQQEMRDRAREDMTGKRS